MSRKRKASSGRSGKKKTSIDRVMRSPSSEIVERVDFVPLEVSDEGLRDLDDEMNPDIPDNPDTIAGRVYGGGRVGGIAGWGGSYKGGRPQLRRRDTETSPDPSTSTWDPILPPSRDPGYPLDDDKFPFLSESPEVDDSLPAYIDYPLRALDYPGGLARTAVRQGVLEPLGILEDTPLSRDASGALRGQSRTFFEESEGQSTPVRALAFGADIVTDPFILGTGLGKAAVGAGRVISKSGAIAGKAGARILQKTGDIMESLGSGQTLKDMGRWTYNLIVGDRGQTGTMMRHKIWGGPGDTLGGMVRDRREAITGLYGGKSRLLSDPEVAPHIRVSPRERADVAEYSKELLDDYNVRRRATLLPEDSAAQKARDVLSTTGGASPAHTAALNRYDDVVRSADEQLAQIAERRSVIEGRIVDYPRFRELTGQRLKLLREQESMLKRHYDDAVEDLRRFDIETEYATSGNPAPQRTGMSRRVAQAHKEWRDKSYEIQSLFKGAEFGSNVRLNQLRKELLDEMAREDKIRENIYKALKDVNKAAEDATKYTSLLSSKALEEVSGAAFDKEIDTLVNKLTSSAEGAKLRLGKIARKEASPGKLETLKMIEFREDLLIRKLDKLGFASDAVENALADTLKYLPKELGKKFDSQQGFKEFVRNLGRGGVPDDKKLISNIYKSMRDDIDQLQSLKSLLSENTGYYKLIHAFLLTTLSSAGMAISSDQMVTLAKIFGLSLARYSKDDMELGIEEE